MKGKYVFVTVLLMSVAILCFAFTGMYVRGRQQEDENLHIVTSFYPVYIAAENIAGHVEGVNLENLSEPQTGCLHDYQLTPEDMKLLSKADVFIINGGGIENFLSKVAGEYPDLVIVDASQGVDLLEENSHVWMSIANYKKQVENITRALGEIDQKNREHYKEHGEEYLAVLTILEKQQEEIKNKIQGEKIILFHEAYDYVAYDYGLEVVYTMDLDEERQVSAGEVADVLAAVKENNISVIFAEELYGSEMAETVEKESDVKVYYLDTLVRGDYDANSYLDGMYENIQTVKLAYGLE